MNLNLFIEDHTPLIVHGNLQLQKSVRMPGCSVVPKKTSVAFLFFMLLDKGGGDKGDNKGDNKGKLT